MKDCEALIIGGSAGSLDVLIQVLPDLDPVLPFPIIIILHRKPGKESLLTDLLRTKTKLRVKDLEEKEPITGSTIYIAPPSYHLLIENNKTFSLDASEKINFSRPAIDVTFESAAQVFEESLVCLLLSGANSDGTAGLQTVKKYGGRAIIQNPGSAIVPFMPEYAMEHVAIDAILDPKEIANYINHLQHE